MNIFKKKDVATITAKNRSEPSYVGRTEKWRDI